MKLRPHLLMLIVGVLGGCASNSHYDEAAVKGLGLTPLPPKELLGAPNLADRDAIFEAVIRSFVSDSSYPLGFVGFEYYDQEVRIRHDPSEEFSRRLSSIDPSLKCVSELMRSAVEQHDAAAPSGQVAVIYYLGAMRMVSEDEAEVYANVVPIMFGYPYPQGTFYSCRVVRQNDDWTTKSKKALRLPAVTN